MQIKQPSRLRLLTCNVWSGLNYRGILAVGKHPQDAQHRYRALLEEILALCPDIIALQEANPLPQYAHKIAADLGYTAVHQILIGGIRIGRLGIPGNLRQGEVLLAGKPWTIRGVQGQRLSGKGIVCNSVCCHINETRKAMLATVDINGTPLNVYIVHLHAGPHHGAAYAASLARLRREFPADIVSNAVAAAELAIARRRSELNKLAGFIRKTLPPGRQAVILGDFNTSSESGDLDVLLAGGDWIDTFRKCNPAEPGYTWDPDNNSNFRLDIGAVTPYGQFCNHHDCHPHRFDYIMAYRTFTPDDIIESRVVFNDSTSPPPSDHYGLLTELRWR